MNRAALTIPAEWELDSDILMTWPHEDTDWVEMLDEIRSCFSDAIHAFTSAGLRVILITTDGLVPPQLADIEKSLLIPVAVETNDTWTRDYGPVAKVDAAGAVSLAKYKFNGWGLKFAADKDNMVTIRLIQKGLLTNDCIVYGDLVAEGGGLESDGRGTILTTAACQMSVSRNGGRLNPGLLDSLCDAFSARRLLMLCHGYLSGDDTDSHIDTLARFAPGDTIVYVGCDDPADEHYSDLLAMKEEIRRLRTADGQPYNMLELPLPDAIFDEHTGDRLPATYANFLATPSVVFMPTYGQPRKDKLARQILQVAFDMPVVTIDCRAMIRQHGSLHCSTMQIPKKAIKI